MILREELSGGASIEYDTKNNKELKIFDEDDNLLIILSNNSLKDLKRFLDEEVI